MRILIIYLGLATLIGCGSSSSTSSTSRNPHAQAHAQMHQELYQEELNKEINRQLEGLAGYYRGTLPCSNCEGILLELELRPDMTYDFSKTYKGLVGKDETASGSFALQSDWKIKLDQPDGKMNFYQKEGNSLKVLDRKGNAIPGNMGELYILRLSEKE